MGYVAFVPLRGGSKSVPRKNVLPIAGKPLCLWAIEAASRARRIDHVYVATDDAEIRQVVEEAGLTGVTVVDRSPETATDTATTESAMIEFAGKVDFDHIVLVQATSPLTADADFDAAVERFEAAGADSLVTVVPQKRFLWSVSADQAVPDNYEPLKRPRRQEFDGYHVENGAFYISKKEGLLRTGSRLFGKIVAHAMAEETFAELDEPVDWTIIEAFLQKRNATPSDLTERAQRLRLVLTDVDGVLTDSGMYYSESGDELKKFNTRDGKGLELLRKAGIEVGIVTAENTKLVERRAKKLQVQHLVQGATDKVADVQRIADELSITLSEVGFIGDDLGDVEILRRVGFAACPQDARPEAKAEVDYCCEAKGGEGAVREFAELILALRS